MRGTPAHAAQDREPSQVCRLGGRQSLQELKTSHLSQLCQQCAHAILELFALLPPQRCPHCRKWICNKQQRE
jgi:hypothetical protein